MCLLLYVVILQQIVVTIVWYCIQIPSPYFPIIYLLFPLLRLQANQSVFILYDVEKNTLCKGMYQNDSCKREKKSTFICTELESDYLFFK